VSGYVSLLNNAATDSVSALHRYRTLAAQGGGVHLFIEGEADRYLYPAVVRRASGEKIIIHELAGYKEILGVFQDVEGLKFKETKRLYFVDRDLSFLSVDRRNAFKEVYCTPGYSVESFLFSKDAIEVAATEIDNLESDSPFIGRCWDLIESNVEVVSPLFISFLAIAVAGREAGLKVNLNNISVSKLNIISKTGQAKRGPGLLSILVSRSGVDPNQIPKDRLKFWRAELGKADVVDWFRGKYIADIIVLTMRKFFHEERANIPRNRKGNLYKARLVSVSTDDVLKDYLPRMRVPRCLDEYVAARLEAA